MNCSISVFNVADSKQQLQSSLKGIRGVENVKYDTDPTQVTFNGLASAQKGIKSLHGQMWNGNTVIAFMNQKAPDIEKGHNPRLLVFKDVPEDVKIPQLWELLNKSKGIICIDVLPSQKQNILIHMESDELARDLLDNAPFTLHDQELKLVSWFDFCFELMMKKVVKLSGLPPDIDEKKIMEFCGYESDIAYVNYVPDKAQAFAFYESAYPVDVLLKKNNSEFLNSRVEIKRYRHSDWLEKIVFVFVNNLPKSVSSTDVRELFSTCGDVLKATFSEDKQTGRKRAVVYFNEKDEAERAFELNGCEYLNETIEVQSNCRRKEQYTVYVTNLHRGTRPIDLCYIFQDCGHIVNVIVPNQQKIVHKGEPAIIYFSKPSSVILALNKHKKAKIRGIRIFVTEEKPSSEDGSKPIINRSKMYQKMAQKRRHESRGGYNDFKRERF